MRLPEIDLEELKKFKEKILQEREEFHFYVEWLKKTGNKPGEESYRQAMREQQHSKKG